MFNYEEEIFPFKELIILFVVVVFLLETYLDYRQYKLLQVQVVPSVLSDAISLEKFEKSQAYGRAKMKFGFVSSLFDFIQNLVIFHFDLLPQLWNYSGILLSHFGYSTENHIYHAFAFCILGGFYNLLVSIPFSIYRDFVLEERFGFNKKTWKIFVTDQLKTIALGIIIGFPVLAAIIRLVEFGGEFFWIYLFLFTLTMTLILTTIYPVVIAPLFNKYKDLDDGELKTAIYELAKKQSFPLTKLFVVDGSIRSNHSNAYFYGFFKNKRIVLYDTLLQHVDTEGVVATLAHELGHWKKGHTIKNLIIAEIYSFIFFYAFGQTLNNKDMYLSFGFQPRPIFIGLLLFSFIYGPIEHLFGFFLNMISRVFEFQADVYACELGYDLRNPLMKLHTENMSELIQDSWYSAYHNNHPTLLERLEKIAQYFEKKK